MSRSASVSISCNIMRRAVSQHYSQPPAVPGKFHILEKYSRADCQLPTFILFSVVCSCSKVHRPNSLPYLIGLVNRSGLFIAQSPFMAYATLIFHTESETKLPAVCEPVLGFFKRNDLVFLSKGKIFFFFFFDMLCALTYFYFVG